MRAMLCVICSSVRDETQGGKTMIDDHRNNTKKPATAGFCDKSMGIASIFF